MSGMNLQLLHIRQKQRLNGGTIYKPILKDSDFQKTPRDLSNVHLSEKDYLSLINDNPTYYFQNQKVIKGDLDYLIFQGIKVNDNELPPSPSPIPWGEHIISTFTIDKVDYYRTQSGYFMKRKQSNKIEVCSYDRYFTAKSFLILDDINHVELKENRFYKKFKNQDLDVPPAGLTRGSNGTFSPVKKSLSKIEEIKNKYKDGVK